MTTGSSVAKSKTTPRNGVSMASRKPAWSLSVWIFVLAFLVLPLAVAPGVFLGHDITPKLIVLLGADCLALLIMPEWSSGFMLLLRARHFRIFCWLLGLSCLSVALSTAFSIHPGLSLAGTTWRRYGAITQVSVMFLSAACASLVALNPGRIANVLNLLVAGGCALAIYAVCQYLGWDPIFAASLYTYEYIGKILRPPATLGHAMYLATFLVPITFIAAARAISAKRNSARILLSLLTAILLLAIVLSGTRSALLGLAVGVAFAALNNLRRFNKQVVVWIGVLLVVSTVAFVAIAGSGTFRTRLAQWVQDAKGGPRLLVWRDSLRLIGEHPFLGSGPETFAGQFRRVESEELANAYPDFYHESPHNYVLDIAVAQGLPGLILGLLLPAAAVYSISRRDRPASAMPCGLLCALLAMFTALQFVPLTLPNAVLFYSLTAILFASSYPPTPTAERRLSGLHRFVTVPIIVLLVAAATLYAAQDSMFASLGRKVAQHDWTALGDEYRSLSRLPFPKPGQDLWFSRQLAAVVSTRQADSTWALPLARQASATSERTSEEPFNALYQSATLAIAAGEMELGERKLRRLIQQAPTWYKPRLLLAQVLVMSGRYDQGLDESRVAASVAGKHRQEVKSSVEGMIQTIRK